MHAILGGEAQGAETPFGAATLDTGSFLQLDHRGQRVLFYIPHHAHELKQRMLVCAQMKEGGHGHRRVDATLVRLQEQCAWNSMDTAIKNMARIVLSGLYRGRPEAKFAE